MSGQSEFVDVLDLHEPANWRRVDAALRLAGRLAATQRVLAAGGVLHSAEGAFAALESDDPVEDLVFCSLRSLVADQASDCGDGGKALVALAVALVRGLAPWYLGEVLTRRRREDLARWEGAGAALLGPLGALARPFAVVDRDAFLAAELAALPLEVHQLARRYFTLAGKYSQVYVVDGHRQESELLTATGYRCEARTPLPLRSPPHSSLRDCLVAVLDGELASPEDLRAVFDLPAAERRSCAVVCRAAGDVAVATVLGNARDLGAHWTVVEVSGDALHDVAAVAGAAVHYPGAIPRTLARADFGTLSRVEVDARFLTAVAPAHRPGVAALVASLRSRVDAGAGEEVQHRLAILTGDYYELALGANLGRAARAHCKGVVVSAIRAAALFPCGTSGGHLRALASALAAVPNPQTTSVVRALAALYPRGLPGSPAPAEVARRAWARAWSYARLLLCSRVALLRVGSGA